MASDLGQKHVTVNQWRHRRSIPAQYWPLIIAKAAGKGFTFTLEQFAGAFLPAACVATCGTCDRRADDPECAACLAPDCGLRQREAA